MFRKTRCVSVPPEGIAISVLPFSLCGAAGTASFLHSLFSLSPRHDRQGRRAGSFFLWACLIAITLCGGARQGQADWTQDVYTYVPEAAGMQIDYALQIPSASAYDTTPPLYAVDNSARIVTSSFSRIGYFLELKTSGGSL